MDRRRTITLFIFASSFVSVYCGVPVLIWESSSVSVKEDTIPALAQLSTDEFSNHLVKKIHVHQPLIVLFLEETLSVEDFSWQDVKHQGSFPQLKNITSMSAKVEFLPSVDDPLEALKDLVPTHDYQWKKYDGKKLPSKPGVILEVKLQDPSSNEDRPDLLRSHDGSIAEIYSQLLAKHSRIVAIFTGKQSSWVELESNRVRRDVDDDFKAYTSTVTILSKSPPELVIDDTPYILNVSSTMADTRTQYQRIILKSIVNGTAVALRFKYESKDADWELTTVEYQSDKVTLNLVPNMKISAPKNKQFTSTKPVIFASAEDAVPTVKLTFKDGLQTEAWSEKDRQAFEFASTESDGPVFFTPAIWSGIMVTFILGLVTAWGITMLMDIRTMDRFDDPKGKTISVNVGD